MKRKGNIGVATAMTGLGILSVIVLTQYGVSKGLPGAASFVLVLAAVFGTLVVKVGR